MCTVKHRFGFNIETFALISAFITVLGIICGIFEAFKFVLLFGSTEIDDYKDLIAIKSVDIIVYSIMFVASVILIVGVIMRSSVLLLLFLILDGISMVIMGGATICGMSKLATEYFGEIVRFGPRILQFAVICILYSKFKEERGKSRSDLTTENGLTTAVN